MSRDGFHLDFQGGGLDYVSFRVNDVLGQETEPNIEPIRGHDGSPQLSSFRERQTKIYIEDIRLSLKQQQYSE